MLASSDAKLSPTVTLNNDYEMPLVGLGTLFVCCSYKYDTFWVYIFFYFPILLSDILCSIDIRKRGGRGHKTGHRSWVSSH